MLKVMQLMRCIMWPFDIHYTSANWWVIPTTTIATEGSWGKTLSLPLATATARCQSASLLLLHDFVSYVPPQTKNSRKGDTKQYNFRCIDKSVIYIHVQCMYVCKYILGLLTHVPFPGFWSASLFSIFRHCDRQTFLLQTLLLLFMVLCANWENKLIRESAI